MPKDPAPPKAFVSVSRLGSFVRALGLNAAAPSVDNAGKRLRHVHAAVRRLGGERA